MSESVDRLLELRRGRSGWSRRLFGFGGAALLHVGLVLGVMFGPQLFAKQPVKPEFVPVMLVPAPALGTPNPAPPRPEPKPPEPEPEPEPEPVATAPPAPEEPPAMVAPDAAPKPISTPKPKPPAARATPTPQAASDAPPTGPPGPRGAPGGAADSPFTASIGGVDNPSFTYGYYLERLILLVAAQWTRPPMGGGIKASIHFRVLPDGRVEDLEIRESSNYSSFDLAAMRAIQNAAPLPPLPRSYREGDLGVTLNFH
jgi:protein TonB